MLKPLGERAGAKSSIVLQDDLARPFRQGILTGLGFVAILVVVLAALRAFG